MHSLSLILSILILLVARPAMSEQGQPPAKEGPELREKQPANEDPEAAAVDTFRDCNTCPEMVVVPAGSFMMGSPADEPEEKLHEIPQHRVTISRSFAVGAYEITYVEWDACIADGGCNGFAATDQGWGRGRRPVVMLTRDHAKAYVAWLSSKTGEGYRLLSEAEWEYVARAGTTTRFWWGNEPSHDFANYSDLNRIRGQEERDRWDYPAPVGSFPANAFGLFDLNGNVFEMVEDCWHNNYDGAPTDGGAWTSASGGVCWLMPVRGGAATWDSRYTRSAFRMSSYASSGSSEVGFRVARDLR